MKFMFDYKGKNVRWMWKDQEKQFHQTYLPKKTELIIVDSDGEDKQEVKDALWESLQPEFQDIRNHMNLKARLRRAKNG